MSSQPVVTVYLYPSVAALAPDGKTVLTGYYINDHGESKLRRPIIQWDMANGDRLDILDGHEGNVTFLEFVPDGKHAVSMDDRGVVQVWDLERLDPIRTMRAGERYAAAAAMTPDGRRLLTVGNIEANGPPTLVLWDVGTGKVVRKYDEIKKTPNPVTLSPDGKLAALVFDYHAHPVEGAIAADVVWALWDLEAGKALKTFRFGDKMGGPTAFSPDGKTVLMYGKSRADTGKAHLVLWNVTDQKMVRSFEPPPGKDPPLHGAHPSQIGTAGRVMFDPDAKRVFSVGTNLMRCWDVASGKEAWSQRLHPLGYLRGFALARDGTFAVHALGGLSVHPTYGYQFHQIELKLQVFETYKGALLRTVGRGR